MWCTPTTTRMMRTFGTGTNGLHEPAVSRITASGGYLASSPAHSSIRVMRAEWSQPPLPLVTRAPNIWSTSAVTGSAAPCSLPAASAISRSLAVVFDLAPGGEVARKEFLALDVKNLAGGEPPGEDLYYPLGSHPGLRSQDQGLGDRLDDEGHHDLVARLDSLTGPGPSDVDDRLAHGPEEGPRPLEVVLVPLRLGPSAV